MAGKYLSKELLSSVEAYIATHYVEEMMEELLSAPQESMDADADMSLDEGTYMIAEPPLLGNASASERPKKRNSYSMRPLSVQKRSLESLVDNLEETFSQMLLRLIDERGLKDSTVYKKANVDRRHFSKIRNDAEYAPTKKTVIAFAIALELSMDETIDLMKRAGFAFSCSSKSDVIISYFIENKKYNIFEINEVLFTYGQPVLGE